MLVSVLAAGPARAALVIGCGQTFELVTQRKDDIEQLVFDAAEHEVVSITVAAAAGQDPNFNPEFFLESPTGDRVFFADGSQLCANAIHQCETQPLSAPGTYTINARDTGRNQKGTFFLTLEAVSATAGGFSNGPGDGPVCQRTNVAGKADGTQPVSVGAPAGGTIDSPGETDTFTFLAEVDQVVTLQVAPLLPPAGPFDPRAVLFDPSGQMVGDVCLANETCTAGPLVAGVHTVKLFDIDYAGTGDYTLLVADPAPPSTTTTTTTTLPTTTLPTTTTTIPTADIYELWKTLRRQLSRGEEMGTAIAADASRVAIGVPFDQTFGATSGRAYVVSIAGLPPALPDYRAPLVATLEKPGGSSATDLFGASVALLEGDGVAVGAPRVDAASGSGTFEDAGAVFLYPGGTELRWPVAANAEFGATLTSHASDLFVGAPGQGSGRVYRFVDGSLSRVFAPSDSGTTVADGARFGAAIAVLQSSVGDIPAGGLLAIGAPADETRPGAVFVLDRTTDVWQTFQRPTPLNGDRFGAAVAFVDGALVIGAPGQGEVFRVPFPAGQVSALSLPVTPSLGATLAPAAGGKVLIGAPRAGPGVVLLVNPTAQTIDLRLTGGAIDDMYGAALAAVGSVFFIASPGDDTGSVDGGAVFMYSATGTLTALLRKREIEAGFGTEVAANDAVIVVGAPHDTGAQPPFDSGVVYSYRPDLCTGDVCLSTWSKSGPVGGGQFGHAIDLTGSAALIGAPSAGDKGAAYLAAVEGDQALLDIPNSSAEVGAGFGFAVATVGNELLVGAPAQGQGTATGEVHIFDGSTQPISLRAKLRNPVPVSGDQFGAAIAAEGNTIAVGAPYDSTAADKAGAVYLFERSSAQLLSAKPLVSPAAMGVEMFGVAVAMDADSIVVGAPSLSAVPARPGRAYVFSRQSLDFVCAIEDPLREAGASFGSSVAIVDGRVLVGAPLTSDRQPHAGAAYLFDPASCEPLQTILSPDAPLGGDLFGKSVSAGPAGPVIGAPGRGKVYVYRQMAPQGLAAVLSVLRDTIVPTAIAAGPQCGNGVVEAGEVCDDGNDDNTDDCRNDCTTGFCCVIDPTAAQRCNDFDPCTNDTFDPATNRCVNVDNGTCCMSNNDCAGDDQTCRVCAGCSLFPWDCCDQTPEARCVLSSPECTAFDCFDRSECECQNGLTCSEPGAGPTDAMAEAFRQSCDVLRLQAGGPPTGQPLAQARTSVKRTRKALRQARKKTRQAYRAGEISKTCRGEYLKQIGQVRESIPTKTLRSCVKQQSSDG